MTGQHLVLCDGPGGDPRAFRSAYARYLANCCWEFVALGAELPAPLRDAHGRVADLVRRTLSVDEGRLLHCFASPTVTGDRVLFGLGNGDFISSDENPAGS